MLMVARVVTPEEVGCLALILFWNNCGADMDRRPITCTHVRLHRLGLTFPTNIRVVLPLCPEEGHSLHGRVESNNLHWANVVDYGVGPSHCGRSLVPCTGPVIGRYDDDEDYVNVGVGNSFLLSQYAVSPARDARRAVHQTACLIKYSAKALAGERRARGAGRAGGT
ncbi:jg15215 [Pararge aegeria aegeria]|uniref:Jg15215 protein n=1 Tax=Pararge aegeria aegeria TaxID=348720 RepID=A0A8S4QGY5_9NEOP|nr:jg15215 [Pararge aegeria aegeria]